MANILGIVGVPIEYPVYISPYSAGERTLMLGAPVGYDTFTDIAAIVTNVTTHHPLKPASIIPAERHHEYSSIFYDRLLIDPVRLGFGSISGDQRAEVSVVNLFLRQDLSLTSLTVTPPEGVSLAGVTAPATLYSLSTSFIDVTVLIDGPRVINNVITLLFTELSDAFTIVLTGDRSVLFPLEFSSPTREQLSWLTEVLTSRNGTEQRRRTRQEPRQLYTTSSFIPFMQSAKIDNLMFGWRANAFSLPLWHESRPSTAPVVAGSPVVSVDPSYGSFTVGGGLIVFRDVSYFEIRTIESIQADSITCTAAFATEFSTGVKVLPLVSARLTRHPSRATTGANGDLQYVLEDMDTHIVDSVTPSPEYLGYEVYLGEALKTGNQGSPTRYNKRIEKTYYETGAANFSTPWSYTKVEQSFSVVKEGLQEIWEFREFLHRLAGKLTPVWMPTQEVNMRVVSTGDLLETLVVQDDYHLSQASRRNHIVIFYKDNTQGFHEITSGVLEDGNVLLRVTPNIQRNAADIDTISYMSLARLSSDNVTLNWEGNQIMTASLVFIGADL